MKAGSEMKAESDVNVTQLDSYIHYTLTRFLYIEPNIWIFTGSHHSTLFPFFVSELVHVHSVVCLF